MRCLRAFSFLFLLIPFFTPGRNTGIDEGVIQGVVRDDIGNPLSGAKVHAELKGVGMVKGIRFVESDKNIESGAYPTDAESYHLPADVRPKLPDILQRAKGAGNN